MKWRLDLKTAETTQVENSSLRIGLEAALEKATPDASVATVHIRFKGSIRRELITSVQQALNSGGFIAPPALRTVEVQSTSIRYYSLIDKTDAEKIASKTAEAFRVSGCFIQLTPVLVASAPTKPRSIDLDIYTSCP